MVEQFQKRQTIINILILVSACLAMYMQYEGNNTLYLFLKPFTTIVVMSLLFFAAKIHVSKFRNIVLAALCFCLLGDILLLYEEYFVLGLAAFLIAHILFTLAFIQHMGFNVNWLTFLILFGIGGSLFYWLRPDLGSFMLPVGAYVIVISFMAWQGIGLFLRNRGRAYAWIAIAVLLFMFSDTMIAISKFKSDFDYSSIIILSTYWLSIALIANAAYRIVLVADNKMP